MEYLFEDGQNLNHKKKSWFKIMKLNEKKITRIGTLYVYPQMYCQCRNHLFNVNNCVCWNKLERKGYV